MMKPSFLSELYASIYRRPQRFKRALSWWAPYLGTGISVASIAPDFSQVDIQMKARWYNRNAFGTHFGGSLYAMTDPFYCLLLVALLGDDYYVWDKSASIEFVQPGKGTVRATFTWSAAQIEQIKLQAAGGAKVLPGRTVDVLDASGELVARVHKTMYVRLKPSKTTL